MTHRFFPDGLVAGGDGGDAVAGDGGGGGEAVAGDGGGGGEAVAGDGGGGGEAVAGDGGGGGEADRCGDTVSFRFFACSVMVCCRGSLGGSR